MAETKTITFKPNIFSKEHKLVLDPEFIELYKSPNDAAPVKFSKLEIDKFRVGIRAVRGLSAHIGKVYCFDIKSTTNNVLAIKLTTFYNIRDKELKQKYQLILSQLVSNFFSEDILRYCKLFDNKLPFSILNVHFNTPGVTLKDKHFIKWNDVNIRIFARYLTISSKADKKVYQTFDYLVEWNLLILHNVLASILKSKDLLNS